MYSECESTHIPAFTIVCGIAATYSSSLIGVGVTETLDGYFMCIGISGYIGAIIGSLVDTNLELDTHKPSIL